MTNANASRDDSKLSPELRRAIAADTIGCFVDNAALKKSDVEMLTKILSKDTDVVSGVVISRKRALGALARSEPSEETGKLLARTLGDRNRSARSRAAAAAYLAVLPATIAERPLLSALNDAAGPLRVEVIKALGQIGTVEALAELRKIQPKDDDLERRQLALALMAIAFREKVASTSTDDLGREYWLRWITAEAEPLDVNSVREIQGAIGGSTFGVVLDPEVGFAFYCGRTRNAMFMNKELKRGEYIKNVTQQPMIAGLIVSKAAMSKYFTLRWLLFTNPAEEGVRIVLVRPNGESAFDGLAVKEARSLHFSLRDIGKERTPVVIKGEMANDTVRWDMRVWQGPIRGKLRPRPIAGAARVGPRARNPVSED